MTAADHIAQTYLDRMARAVIVGDWDAYRAGVSLPFLFVTGDSRTTITDLPALRQGYDAFRDYLRAEGITDIIRQLSRARFDDLGQLAMEYVTHYLRRADRVLPPVPGAMLLRSGPGGWRALSVSNSLPGVRWPVQDLRLPSRVTPTG
jgi:hypothetical protein